MKNNNEKDTIKTLKKNISPEKREEINRRRREKYANDKAWREREKARKKEVYKQMAENEEWYEKHLEKNRDYKKKVKENKEKES